MSGRSHSQIFNCPLLRRGLTESPSVPSGMIGRVHGQCLPIWSFDSALANIGRRQLSKVYIHGQEQARCRNARSHPLRKLSLPSPSPMASFSVSTIHSARDIPAAVWDVFRENAQASNVMYAHADNAFKSPTPDGTADSWVVVWDLTEPSGTSAVILFVLSCTTGPLGPYPIFIFTPLPAASLVRDFVGPRILAMARALRLVAAPERVFSVFAVDALADAFAASWTVETGIQLDSNPVYYHASLMCCDRNTLRTPPPQCDVTFASRLATAADVEKVSVLCQDFSATSVSGRTLDRWLMF